MDAGNHLRGECGTGEEVPDLSELCDAKANDEVSVDPDVRLSLERQLSIRSNILEEHQDVPYDTDIRGGLFSHITDNSLLRNFQKKKRQPKSRCVYVNNISPIKIDVTIPQKFPDNKIISSKYTLWNFIPKNLFEQFRRIANFYFLCIGIIQLFLEDTPVSPATSILPLIFVVSVTAVKQGYEDYLRHKADLAVNNRPAFVIREGKSIEVRSQDVKVGDIVYVTNNEGFPCDLIMLSSSDQDGQCYITTANLDGETNLKIHCCLPDTKHLGDEQKLWRIRASIECEEPTADLYKFIGRMTIYNSEVHSNATPIVRSLGPENILLRGARLKNTDHIYGCAVYTGQQTKMALNSKFTSAKFSTVEKSMNIFLIVFLIILIVEAFTLTLIKNVYEHVCPWPWYLPDEKPVNFRNVLQDILSFLVLLNYVIPISLYVTLEMQKFVGSLFFSWDIEMYDMVSDIPAKVNTSDLNEELGQVEYLFTDKTGTLTENDMVFRQCTINGKKYAEVGSMLCEVTDTKQDISPLPLRYYTAEIKSFMEVLVVCHTIHVHKQDQGNKHKVLEYQASSPDEKALAEACRRFGITFLGTKGNRSDILMKDEVFSYEILHVLDFDATRKCMSIIVKTPQGEIYLLCKGAESTLLSLVTSGPKEKTLEHVNDFAVAGLRTLVMANKKLNEEQYSIYDGLLNKARSSLHNREEKIAEVYSVIERDLHLLGASAVEDRLQDGVQETIEALRAAGIKFH